MYNLLLPDFHFFHLFVVLRLPLPVVVYCRWKQDAITLIDKLLPEAYQEVIIVGGGVGGWIATLIALERPEKGA